MLAPPWDAAAEVDDGFDVDEADPDDGPMDDPRRGRRPRGAEAMTVDDPDVDGAGA